MNLDLVRHWIPSLKPTRDKNVWISEYCPFTNYKGNKRLFRYNHKLKVGKCYCCGNAFKEVSWLIAQIKKPVSTFVMMQRHSGKRLNKPEAAEKYIRYYIRNHVIKENAMENKVGFVKPSEQEELPF